MGNTDTDFDLSVIEKDERVLAKVLLKNNLVKPEVIKSYLEFMTTHNEEGKFFLGEIMKNLSYISQDDIKEFMDEQEGPYLEFCKVLVDEGFLTEAQYEGIMERHDNGKPVLEAIKEMNIMTRDNFVRIYAKRMGGLRLGEWLVIKKKVSQDQVEEARRVQKINTLPDFLVHYQHIDPAVLNKVLDKIASVI